MFSLPCLLEKLGHTELNMRCFAWQNKTGHESQKKEYLNMVYGATQPFY